MSGTHLSPRGARSRPLWLPLLACLAPLAGAQEVDYVRELRPLLAARCFACHGPDAAAREADLRLDTAEGLAADLGGYHAVVPGNLEESELWQRVFAEEDAERMPPPEAGPRLDEAELDLVRRWIEGGAPSRPHWSFEPLRRPAVPQVERTDWVRNPIDAFVLARLEDAGLEPSPPAGARTLLRRLALDLEGLPPEPEELAAFEADAGEAAFERALEQRLASDRHAERLTLLWLDLARYADTDGYSLDAGRTQWPWRDWVLEAFRANMPFDRFATLQLAGDLLPSPTREERVATGFNRNHMVMREEGAIPEEYRVAYVADRAQTTAEAFLGLTLGCAQCHDHKYDPITQRDFYRFSAFFASVPDVVTHAEPERPAPPVLALPTPEEERRVAELEAELDRLRRELHADSPAADELQLAWEREKRQQMRDLSAFAVSPWQVAGPFVAEDGDAAFEREWGPEHGIDLGQRFEGGQRWQPRPDLVDGPPQGLEGERAAHYLTRTLSFPTPIEVLLEVGSDDALRLWHEGELVLSRNLQQGDAGSGGKLPLLLAAGENRILLKVVNYLGPCGFRFRVLRIGPPREVLIALGQPRKRQSAEQRALLKSYHREVAPEFAALRQRIARLEAELAAAREEIALSVMVMEELAVPRPTFVLERGQYDRRGERVEPGVPAFLPPMPADAPANRLGLARWIVDPANPLTARVLANRLWQMLFGVGLVESAGDFGVRGTPPTHPELLDWLATELVESGWDLRHLLRLICGSATWRQDSAPRSEAAARDVENRLLWRGARFCLQAELVRDLALAASGLLVERLGGAPVHPYQPPGLWEEVSQLGKTAASAQSYVQGHGEDLWRRSLYTFWKRAVPPPSMELFDAPKRELCTHARAATSTPLQALVLQNDPTFVEAARALAARVLAADGGDEERAALAFELATSRRPGAEEAAVLAEMLAERRARWSADPEGAKAYLEVGEWRVPAELEPAEHAAWTELASLVLNLAESMTRS